MQLDTKAVRRWYFASTVFIKKSACSFIILWGNCVSASSYFIAHANVISAALALSRGKENAHYHSYKCWFHWVAKDSSYQHWRSCLKLCLVDQVSWEVLFYMFFYLLFYPSGYCQFQLVGRDPKMCSKSLVRVINSEGETLINVNNEMWYYSC